MNRLRESLAGPGYVILNAIRVLNIIAFLDIIAASVVMLVKINMLNSFFFFEAVTHAVVAIVSSKSVLFYTHDIGLIVWQFSSLSPSFLFCAPISMITGPCSVRMRAFTLLPVS